MVQHSSETSPAQLVREHRRRLHRSALHWGAGALGFLLTIVLAFIVYASVRSLDDLAVWVTMFSILALAICILIAAVRMIESLLPYHPPTAWIGDPDADVEVVMAHGRANNRWVRRAQVCFLGAAVSIIIAVLVQPWFTPLIWIGIILFVGATVSFGGVLVQNSRAASAIDRLDHERAARYGADLAEQLTVRHGWAPLHWWEWLAEFVFIMGVIMGGIILMDAGINGGWLPRSRDVALGIMSSLSAVFIILALMIWALLRTPWHKAQRPYLIVVTLIAAAVTVPVGIIGSLERWPPFVSRYSGRGAGAILGAVFVGAWLAGYHLTKREASRAG